MYKLVSVSHYFCLNYILCKFSGFMLETCNTQLSPSKKMEVKGNDEYMSCKLVCHRHLLLTATFVWCLFFDK